MQKELPEYLSYLPDFEHEAARERLSRLEHDQARLSKQVNFKVEAMTE
jgi:structural maintenance of chromosome 2